MFLLGAACWGSTSWSGCRCCSGWIRGTGVTRWWGRGSAGSWWNCCLCRGGSGWARTSRVGCRTRATGRCHGLKEGTAFCGRKRSTLRRSIREFGNDWVRACLIWVLWPWLRRERRVSCLCSPDSGKTSWWVSQTIRYFIVNPFFWCLTGKSWFIWLWVSFGNI